MIDAHAHLDAPKLLPEVEQVLARMREAGVIAALVIGTDLPSSQIAVDLARRYPEMLRATVGVHPHESANLDDAGLDTLRELAAQPEVVAIGEIGLDFHYNFSPPESQCRALRRQLRLAEEMRLPLVIHEREAVDALTAILDEEDGWARGGSWHCCSVTPERAIEIARAFYVGIAGWITFPKADNIRALAHAVPLERLLVETDSPYLAPVPYRGKTNEPAHVRLVAQALADLKGISFTEVEAVTMANTMRAFPRWKLAANG